jgi:cell wall-associated NlpC family hydrolase
MRFNAMFLLGFALITTAGCASRPPGMLQPEPVVRATPPGAGAEPVTEAAFMALSLVGTPYAAGGASVETGFDCSGLVAYVYERALKLSLPRNTFDLARMGVPIVAAELSPGDLVFYNTLRRPFSHVGIYLGDLRFVHAPSTGGAVRVEDMRLGYWTRRFDGARRLAF